MNKISAAVLAGGKNVRMEGEEKAFIRIGDMPILARIISLLKELFDEIIMPRQTRFKLIQALEMTQNKTEIKPPKKHGNIPL